jgi:hypothetical protein
METSQRAQPLEFEDEEEEEEFSPLLFNLYHNKQTNIPLM